MQKLLTLLFIVNLVLSGYGQELGIAINIANDGTEIGKLCAKRFVEEVTALNDDRLVIYDWDQKKHKLSLSPEANTPEKPVEIAYFVEQVTPPLDYKKVNVTFNSNLKGDVVMGAFLAVDFEGRYLIKAVDVRTGKILLAPMEVKLVRNMPSKAELADKRKSRFVVTHKKAGVAVDIKKYVKGTKKAAQLQYNHTLKAKMINTNKEKLQQAYLADVENRLNSIVLVSNKLDSLMHPKEEIFEVEVPDIEAKKIKKMIVHVGVDSGVKKFDRLDVYSVKKIEDKEIPFFIARIFVDKVDGGKAFCSKSGINFSLEDMANQLREGRESLFAVKAGVAPLSKSSYTDADRVNVAIDNGDCMMCSLGCEDEMIHVPTVNLIERNAKQELNQLLDLYKDGRFVDYDLGDYQDRQLGVRYFLSEEDHYLSISDTKTGKEGVVGKLKSLADARGYSLSQAWRQLLLEFSDMEMVFLNVTFRKKNKILGIKVFHPFGFVGDERFDISVLKEEHVGGKVIARKEKIANVWAYKPKGTAQIGDLAVMSGKKELYQAISSGEKLVFTPAVRR